MSEQRLSTEYIANMRIVYKDTPQVIALIDEVESRRSLRRPRGVTPEMVEAAARKIMTYEAGHTHSPYGGICMFCSGRARTILQATANAQKETL